MSGMEKIVRPFQSGDVFSARSNVQNQAAPISEDTAVIEWAGGQTAIWTEAPPPVTQGVQVTWQEDRSRRITEEVRVENPDDSTQFVQLERIKSTVFKNDKTGEEMPIKLDWGT